MATAVNPYYSIEERLTDEELEAFTWIARHDGFYAVDRVIYNKAEGMTIVYFIDGKKITSKCTPDDKFNPEVGLAMCIAKRYYTRGDFKRLVKEAQWFEKKG
jgi:hypothetical protein